MCNAHELHTHTNVHTVYIVKQVFRRIDPWTAKTNRRKGTRTGKARATRAVQVAVQDGRGFYLAHQQEEGRIRQQHTRVLWLVEARITDMYSLTLATDQLTFTIKI